MGGRGGVQSEELRAGDGQSRMRGKHSLEVGGFGVGGLASPAFGLIGALSPKAPSPRRPHPLKNQLGGLCFLSGQNVFDNFGNTLLLSPW